MKKQCWFFHNWSHGNFWETPRGNAAISFTRKFWDWRVCLKCGKVEAQVHWGALSTGKCFNEPPEKDDDGVEESKEEAKKISTKSYTKRSTKCPKCGYYD